MGLFNKIFGSNDKIKVQFIDNLNGQTIGVSEMQTDQLPETFSVPTTMHIQGNDWKIEEAIPENSIDFSRTKNLILKMRKIEKINPNDLWFSTPTISNDFPATVPLNNKTEFDIYIHEDDYRQIEFLNSNALPLVEEEFKEIKNIRDNFSQKSEDYTLFKNCHVRKIIGKPNLIINFNELKTLLGNNSIGQVIINGEVLSDSFTLKTDNTIYFGTLKNEIVSELCVSQWNKFSAEEISHINKTFDLLFVNWPHCDIIKND